MKELFLTIKDLLKKINQNFIKCKQDNYDFTL